MPKLHTLQSLRAIAALLVVLNHALGIATGHGLPREPLSSLADFFGAQGVAIFFLISGFIMTYTSDTPDDASPAASRALRFAAKRLARVAPLYWLFTLLTAAIAAATGLGAPLDLTPLNLFRSLLFLPYRNAHGVMLPVLPLGWTLNYEMFFYTLFAAALLLPHHRRIAILATTLIAAVAIGAIAHPVLSGHSPLTPAEFFTHPILLLFGLGAVMGWLRLRRPQLTLPIPGLLATLPLLAINVALFLALHQNPIRLPFIAPIWLLDCAIVALCIVGKPTSSAWLEAIGNASYSLYLTHILPLFLCFILWKQVHFAAPLLFLAASIALSVAAALAAYRWIERPLTRAASRLLATHPVALPLDPPSIQAALSLET